MVVATVATELILSYQDGRIRVIYQYAPVWENGVEPGSCLPQGLKLFRILVSKEARRLVVPTAAGEQELYQQQQQSLKDMTSNNNNNSDENKNNMIYFYRPIPPFQWHKKWSGTCWTWGMNAGNRGWQIDEMNANSDDAWHGIAPPALWNLRLSGGILIQCPRVITSSPINDVVDDDTTNSITSTAELFRLAWLVNDQTLLRLETGIIAFKPMIDPKDSSTIIGFEQPKLVSYRCDILQNMGDLEGQPTFVWQEEEQLQRQQQQQTERNTINPSSTDDFQ
jgi:hypothetical protein